MDIVRQIDLGILAAFNQQAGKSLGFDRVVVMLESNSLVKTGLLVGLLWYSWFSMRDQPEVRRRSIRTLLGVCLAILCARAAQRLLPPVPRPLRDPALNFQLPYSMDHREYGDWSAFPSDHAVMLCALAAGLWTISRRFGVLAFAWAAVLVFPVRLYTGLHYPSDILAGGLLGFGIAWLASRDRLIAPRIVDAVLGIEARRPALFYTAAFILTWQVADLFGGSRALVTNIWRAATNP